ncbi:AP endonuclease, partial [Clostridium sporogenes]
FKSFDIKGCIICESPILEKDALLLKEYYKAL